jgi:hypothetical protein
MTEENKYAAVLPSLLAGAAIYFGLSKKSTAIGDLTKEALNRVVDDQMTKQKQHHTSLPASTLTSPPAQKSKKRNRNRRKAVHNKQKGNQPPVNLA